MPNKKKQKIKVVTRKFLLDLAETIYNPKTKRFLNLCAGTLRNGPDPENKKRTMHCGLGELYFAMTGQHPSKSMVEGDGEQRVIALAIKSTDVATRHLAALAKARKILPAFWLHDGAMRDSFDLEDDPKLWKLSGLLEGIPDQNDDPDYCSFGERSQRVAALLKKAAMCLPPAKKAKR